MWKKARTLGRGSFGLVSLAISQPNDESKLNLPSLMAVKSTETFQHHSLQKESNLLTELNDCPNILRCYSSFISNDNDNNNVEPIRNFFAALFLANIGMLIHVHFLWNHIDILLAAVILVIVIKTLVVASVVKGFRYNNKTSLLVGISLAQIGEFAFVLLSRASNVHLVEGKLYLLLLGTTALSLLVPGGSPDEQESLVFATLAGDLILIHLSKKIAGKIAGIDPLEQITKRCIRIVETTETDVDGCALCRGPGFSKSVFGPQIVILCDQCEKEYHIGCLKEHKMDDLKELPKGKWFCCMDCNRVYSALQNLVVSGEQKLQDSLLSIIKKKLEEKGSESSADLDIKWKLLSGQMASDNTRLLLSKAVSIFHIYGDPEAADIVFTSGANIVIIGINIQHKS